jgi:prepilin-type N-terminal cleavage/methylation domain-containing protein
MGKHIPRPGRGEAGFTLIELIFVSAIIAIIAAISIPQVLEARSAAYELDAQTYLKRIHEAELSFQARYGRWAPLIELEGARLVNPNEVPSYTILLTLAADGGDYSVSATPLVRPERMRHLFLDASGIVRWAVGAPANGTSTPY